ncbi:MAG: poly-gamma-glutamate system protein [Candidatus Eisenbacteria bacterium]|uniref:Poly-gamma-glutamate system protein n=1 Tax=Eiseniibacteriota bacterium TaxID=2212470 RepID=A0A937X659_UNCEI|nr:poly-gamma-glutamate system protein [Candidatus Eisenbacteria bacterium]
MAYSYQTQRRILVGVLAVLAVACTWILEETKVYRRAPGYEVKKRAAELADRAYDALKDYYVGDLGRTINPDDDPAATGMIGPRSSPIRNSQGNLAAKRTSINPNFAAVIVDYFQQINLKPGDVVAVALSSSFPAMTVNLYAAMEAMELQPVVITTVGSSTWGATDPDFTWLDMERVLQEKGLMRIRSVAATPGGSNDMGNSLSAEGRRLVAEACERNGVRILTSRNILDAISNRMDVYFERAGGRDIAAYVNVGGSIASLGFSLAQIPLPSGLHTDLWTRNFPRAGTMVRLAKMGVPVIHLGLPQNMARRFGLPVAPDYLPAVGDGEALGKPGYNIGLTAAMLVFYGILTLILTLPELRRRFVKTSPGGAA